MITNETKTATCELCGGTGLRGGAGEQRCSCGAVPPSPHILDLLDQYWNIAYQQGIESRSHDNEAGDAQRVLSEITAALTTEARLREIGIEDYDLDELRPILDEPGSAIQHVAKGERE